MTHYDAVIFDLDGTVTESEPGIISSVKYALDRLGIAGYTDATLRSFIGPPLFETFRDVVGLNEATAHEGVRLYRERFGAVGWSENSVYPGMARLIRSLKKNGVYVGMATAKPRVFAERILHHFGLHGYFDSIVAIGLNDMHADKPELVRRALPDVYRRAAMVGDRRFDMEGAKANGIDAVGALYGYGTREELQKSGADFICEDVEGLTKHLLGGLPVAEGAFITLEGPDGCGKSTQITRLVSWLTDCGHEVVLTREPGGCPVSERIREILLDVKSEGMTPLCEALLFAAARAQHIHDVIRPAVARGAIVISDRFIDSSIAYQGAGRKLGVEFVRQINAPVVEGAMPDLTVFLDIDPDAAMARRVASGQPDRIESEQGGFVRRVYEGYLSQISSEPKRIARIDATGDADTVAVKVREVAMARLN